jgi:serine/threonine protein kinase
MNAVETLGMGEPTHRVVAAVPPCRGSSAMKPDLPEFEDFQIISKIGQGAMGEVYKARQISLDQVVALKVLAPHLSMSTQFVGRFRREARASVKVAHPNIVRGIAVGAENGRHYFAMEYVDGENAQQLLARHGRLPVGEAVRIISDVARALAAAEACGLVHRDIKPANIMITGTGAVKLADLGLAKTMEDDDGLSKTGISFGTPAYMPPEQLTSVRDVDVRSDIYALGVTLYHFLTGKKPFNGRIFQLIAAKERGEFEPAAQLNPSIPPALELVMRKMMAPEPEDRYASARELVKALEQLDLTANPEETTELAVDGDATTHTALSLNHPAQPKSETVVRSPRPRRREALLALAAAALAAFSVYWFRPGSGPEPVAPPIDPLRLNRSLSRAYAEIGAGRLDEAREYVASKVRQYPGVPALDRLLRELEGGVLVFFQSQTPEETLPIKPLWDAGGAALGERDRYRFAIVPSRPCFLYGYQLDEQPSVTMLFPSPVFSSRENPLPARRVHWLPDDTSGPGQWIPLAGEPGTEKIYFVGLSKPLRDPEAVGRALLENPQETVARLTGEPDRFSTGTGAAATSCFAGDAVQGFSFQHASDSVWR